MRRTHFIVAVAFGCTAYIAGAAFAATASASPTSVSDAQITREVQAKLKADMPFSAEELRVSTRNGVVTLSGRAETNYAEVRAIEDAHGVTGVTKVKNELTVVS